MADLWGKYLWGEVKWGGEVAAALPVLEKNNYYKLLFFSPEGDKIGEISSQTGQNVVNEFDFELNETGCGAFNINLTQKIFDLRVGDIVEIYLMGEFTPYYTGYIQKVPEEGKTDKLYKYSGYGLIAKFDEIVIDDTYSSQEVSLIIKDILDNQIIPKKPEIIKNDAKIDITTYTVSDYYFNLTSAKKAISDLVDVAGNYIAGVDELKEFFFKARSTAIQQAAIKAVSKHLTDFSPNQENTEIINRIYVKIGDLTAGSNYITTIEDLASQNDYGIREGVETLPTTDNAIDAAQWAAQILALKKDPTITATITNINILFLRERIRAEGKARILLIKE